MIYTNNVQTMAGALDFTKAGKQQQDVTLGSSFKDILGGLMGSSDSEDKSNQAVVDPVKSFRDIVRAKIEHVDLNKMAETKKKVDAALAWLSNYLGIPKGLLLTVLKELKIDPNDMADPMKLPEIIKKIAGKFGLDEKQEAEMTKELNGIFGFTA